MVFSTPGGMSFFPPQYPQPDRRAGLASFSSQEAEFPLLINFMFSLYRLFFFFFKEHIPIYSSVRLKILVPNRFLPSNFMAKAA